MSSRPAESLHIHSVLGGGRVVGLAHSRLMLPGLGGCMYVGGKWELVVSVAGKSNAMGAGPVLSKR